MAFIQANLSLVLHVVFIAIQVVIFIIHLCCCNSKRLADHPKLTTILHHAEDCSGKLGQLSQIGQQLESLIAYKPDPTATNRVDVENVLYHKPYNV